MIFTLRDIDMIIDVFEKYNREGLIPRLNIEEAGLLNAMKEAHRRRRND